MADRRAATIEKPVVSTQTDVAQSGAASSAKVSDAVLEEIRKAIHSVRFGNVQIIVQDGRVVQIDKTEKIRLA